MTPGAVPTTFPNPSLSAPKPGQRQQLTAAAQRFVSHAFFGTLLKQMHDSPFKSELFSGGRGGQTFGALLDQHLADRMAGAKSTQRLVTSIVNRIENKSPEDASTEPFLRPNEAPSVGSAQASRLLETQAFPLASSPDGTPGSSHGRKPMVQNTAQSMSPEGAAHRSFATPGTAGGIE